MKTRLGGMRKGEISPIIIRQYGGQKWIDPIWYAGDIDGKVSISAESQGSGNKDQGLASPRDKYGVSRTDSR